MNWIVHYLGIDRENSMLFELLEQLLSLDVPQTNKPFVAACGEQFFSDRMSTEHKSVF